MGCVILSPVQTPFYASGFLYSLKTHQILLVPGPLYSMLGGESMEGEDSQAAFQRIVNKLLDLKIKPKDIYPIYDYFSDTTKQPHFVFYAEVGSNKKFNKLKKGTLSWLRFSEILKLPFSLQTKQDMVVGERVINAKWRDDEAKKLLPI